jgi:hypothetical protein
MYGYVQHVRAGSLVSMFDVRDDDALSRDVDVSVCRRHHPPRRGMCSPRLVHHPIQSEPGVYTMFPPNFLVYDIRCVGKDTTQPS